MENAFFTLDDIALKIKTKKYRIQVQAIHLSPHLYYIQNHSHKGFEIHYVIGGKGVVMLPDSKYSVQEGTVYITGPDVVHEQISDPGQVIMEYCLAFDLSQLKNTKAVYHSYDADYVLDKLNEIRFWTGPGSRACFMLWNKLANEANTQKIGCYSNICAYILQLLIETVRFASESPRIHTPLPAKSPQEQRVAILDSYMLWSATNITLEKLAGLLQLSTKQTSRLIKRQYGMTFKQRLTKTRLDIAIRLLTATNLSVSEISKAAGYSSIHYFSKRFKAKYGISPAEYRKRTQ